MQPKDKILNLLLQTDSVISGEALSAELGVSRVSVWKHIKKMVQTGIPILSTPKGYRLDQDPDSLLPWMFTTRGSLVHFFEETTSTMDEATALARKGCPAFTVAVAQRQTMGRGRMERSWLSADGGLYFTVVLRPTIPLELSGLVNMSAAVDMAEVLKASYGIDACVKWPNDILVDGGKICGILSQMEVEGDQVSYMNIGIGLNVNNRPEVDEPVAVSMKSLLGKSIPRREILEAFLDLFEKSMTVFKPSDVIDKWRMRNVTLGRTVRVVTVRETVEGTAIDVNSQGALIVQRDDGTQQTVMYGDCFQEID
jgi:BirA family biotin operon repressor/biotin-[acetyl-CoA-carboxylase] ligase